MIAYKGTTNNKCINITYEVGKTYEFIGELRICHQGFHFCRNFIDIHEYYEFWDKNNKYFEIEVLGEVIDRDNKSVTNKFKILREIPREEFHLIDSECFDIYGDLIKKEFSYGLWTKKYDEHNNLIKIINSLGHWISYTYDKNNNLVKAEYKDGTMIVYEYDKNNNLIKRKDTLGHWTSYTYDKNNNKIKIETSSETFTNYTYDENNNKIKEEHSNGSWFSYTYDKNNLIKEEYSNGSWRLYEYDENNNLKHYKDDEECNYTIEIKD